MARYRVKKTPEGDIQVTVKQGVFGGQQHVKTAHVKSSKDLVPMYKDLKKWLALSDAQKNQLTVASKSLQEEPNARN